MADVWEKLHKEGFRCQLAGQWDEAKRYYEQAIVCKPDYAPSQLALAQWHMRDSVFNEGGERYEWRFNARDASASDASKDWRDLPAPRWRGETLTGKHLHLWVEQGFGDVLMYAAFLPWLLAQQPARITLSMFPKMMTLFARSFPHIWVESLHDIGNHALARGLIESFPPLLAMAQAAGMAAQLEPMRQDYEQARARGIADYAAPMGDLLVYGLPGYVPSQYPPCLSADPLRRAEMEAWLQALGPGRRIGIAWHSDNPESGQVRSIPLAQWLPILRVPGCRFIALQSQATADDIKRFCAESGCAIAVSPGDFVADTEGFAALAAGMDEVISIDNSTIHLAGALGIPSMLLLPKGYDFRWPIVENSADTLWYRSVKTERQEQAFDWPPVIARVATALHQRSQ